MRKHTVHSNNGMAPSKVSYSDILEIWRRMNDTKTLVLEPKYSVGQYVRITKEICVLQKGPSSIIFHKFFRVTNVIKRRLRTVYDLQDLNITPIDGHFYQEELVPIRISKRK
jgi:hypothetical protein